VRMPGDWLLRRIHSYRLSVVEVMWIQTCMIDPACHGARPENQSIAYVR